MLPSGPREQFLEVLVAWQRRLLDCPDQADAELLGRLGTAAGAVRVMLGTITRGPGGWQVRPDLEWCPSGPLCESPWGELPPEAADRMQRGEAAVTPNARVLLPVAVGGELVGVLGLERAAERPWTADEITLLGEAVAALAAARERRRAEQCLRAGEERYRRLISDLPVGVYRTTPDGRVLLCNAEASRLTGWAGGDAAAEGVENGAGRAPPPRPQFHEQLEREGEVRGLEADWPGQGTSGRVVRENARLVRHPDGTPAYYEGTLEDVTERVRAEQSLRASEARYRTLMEQASDAIFVLDAAGRLEEVNSRACALLGWPREQLLGRPAREVIAAPDLIARPLRAPVAGETITYERALVQRDGSRTPVEVSLRTLDDGRQMAIVRDIRERKAAERDLRVARYALENAPESIFLLAPDGRLLDVNEAACRRLGYSRHDLLRLMIWDIDATVPRERWPARWERLRRGQRNVFESVHRTRDGRLIPVEVTSATWNFDGQEYATAFCRDITGRRQAEEALRFFKFTADQTADPVYWLRPDRGFRLTYVNRAACTHFGLPESELLQLSLSDLDPNYPPDACAKLWAGLAQKRSQVFESVHHRADGRLVPVEVSANRIEFGGTEYLTGYIRDISERRKAESELTSARQRAAEAEKMRALGQVASGVAHDFNNVLMAVLGLTEVLLARTDLPEEAKALLKSIRTAGQDAHETVRRLQMFARQHENHESRQVLPLNEVVTELPALTKHRWADEAQRRGATIRFVTDLGAGAPVSVNPSEIREVLVNLIFNAVDAMPQGGTITLATGVRDGRTFAAVRDTGTGMDEETRRRCLEPFFTTKGFEGSGIGLAVSWSIVQRHGGEIQVESRLGEGSSFTVWLPAAATALAATAPVTPVTACPTGTRGRRLLVIDDQPVVAQAVSALLSRLGHTAEVALGGQAGIDRFRAGPFDAVITDLGMPDVDGSAVAAAVKATDPQVPVLLLTGWGEDLLASGDHLADVDGIVAKPVTLQKLREVVDRLFQGVEQPGA